MLQDPGTKLLSDRLLGKRLYRTYPSDITKTWSPVSCEALELYEVDFLTSPVRWYWGSRPDCPSIKLSESAASEPLP